MKNFIFDNEEITDLFETKTDFLVDTGTSLSIFPA